jgi:hypothetical protein
LLYSLSCFTTSRGLHKSEFSFFVVEMKEKVLRYVFPRHTGETSGETPVLKNRIWMERR